ncbi:MAG TPA: urate oxidase [Gemmataceae bacterium]|nr:urate oxidase [Gemmataceae bacterium]
MSNRLGHCSYGKSRVRLTKVTRHAGLHEIRELSIAVQLEGAFAASYTLGDNRQIITTDTMKNTVYALARNHPITAVEDFGLALAGHFMENFDHVSASTIRLNEQSWQRMVVDGTEHPHAFVGGGSEERTSVIKRTQQGSRVESGVRGLRILKTANSGFKGFLRDRYTTLPATDDRIFATLLTARWRYGEGSVDWNHCHQLIRRTLLETFAKHKSLSVQQTLYAMATAALDSCTSIQQIRLAMPNLHHLLVDLGSFGLDNPNVVFVPTAEPYGLIMATVRRG